jgi:dolichol-phosphate mannosyltransferase
MDPPESRAASVGAEPALALPATVPGTIQISAVLPVYDERENLPTLTAEIERVLTSLRVPFEIILVDDGSVDGSAEWIREASLGSPRVIGVLFERRAGQSAALVAGMKIARGDWIVTMDADGQNDPADLPLLLDKLQEADVVSGVRAERQDRWTRRISSRIANGVRRRVLGDTLTDIGCSLKVYRKSVLEGLPAFAGVHRFLPALCQFRGARVVELPVRHRPRLHGRSKYGVGNRLVRGIRDLFGVLWLRARLLNYRIREVTHA